MDNIIKFWGKYPKSEKRNKMFYCGLTMTGWYCCESGEEVPNNDNRDSSVYYFYSKNLDIAKVEVMDLIWALKEHKPIPLSAAQMELEVKEENYKNKLLKILAKVIIEAAKMREKSFDNELSNMDDSIGHLLPNLYGMSIEQASKKAIKKLEIEDAYIFPVYLLLTNNWTDILIWAKLISSNKSTEKLLKFPDRLIYSVPEEISEILKRSLTKSQLSAMCELYNTGELDEVFEDPRYGLLKYME